MLLTITPDEVQNLAIRYIEKVRNGERTAGTFGNYVCREVPALLANYDAMLHSQQPDSTVFMYLLRSKSYAGFDMTRGLPSGQRVRIDSLAIELHALTKLNN